MGTISFSRRDVNFGRSSLNASFAYSVMQAASSTNTNINDTVFDTVEGWQTICRTTGITDTETKDVVDIAGGLPELYHDSIVTAIKEEIEVTFTSPRAPLGTQIATGSEIAVIPVYGTGSTTFTSATDSGNNSNVNDLVTVASAANFAVGDTVEFDLTDATYGGFKQADRIIAINGNILTLADGLDYAPASGSTVKNILSYTEYSGGNRLAEFKFRRLDYYTNGAIKIHYYGIGKISTKKEDVNDGKSAKSNSFMFKVVPRVKTLTDISGSSCSKPFTKVSKWILPVGLC